MDKVAVAKARRERDAALARVAAVEETFTKLKLRYTQVKASYERGEGGGGGGVKLDPDVAARALRIINEEVGRRTGKLRGKNDQLRLRNIDLGSRLRFLKAEIVRQNGTEGWEELEKLTTEARAKEGRRKGAPKDDTGDIVLEVSTL